MVIHGTDTMAFAASALAFVLENLQKTVVLTGAQVTRAGLRQGPVLPGQRGAGAREPGLGWQGRGPGGWQEAGRDPPGVGTGEGGQLRGGAGWGRSISRGGSGGRAGPAVPAPPA